MSNKKLKIKSVLYLHDYILKIVFKNNEYREVDFYPFLKNSTNEQIRKYLSIDKFKSYQIVDNDLMWGDFDLIFPIQDIYDNKISA